MKFEPDHPVLKNGASVTIRKAVKKDAPALIILKMEFVANCPFSTSSKGEFFPTKREEAARIQQFNTHPATLLLVATYREKIIGCLELKAERKMKTCHNALLGLVIAPKWQNQGLGSVLLEQAINWGKTHPDLENLWLQVVANHTQALYLYEKKGFKRTGRQPRYLKDTSGGYFDLLTLWLSVAEEQV